jgi:hypothetical protein
MAKKRAKQDYKKACSALRWIGTYDPQWDYWHRHYPRFDEDRDPHAELQSVSNCVLGAAYRTCEYEVERRDPYVANRYRDRMIAKKERSQRIVQYNTKIVSVEYADGRIEKRS